MSNTYSLVCRPLRLKLWVGEQSSNGDLHLYTADDHTEALRQFLQHTQFKPLELTIDGCDDDVAMFDEFKVAA
jgi:hypothetical protein